MGPMTLRKIEKSLLEGGPLRRFSEERKQERIASPHYQIVHRGPAFVAKRSSTASQVCFLFLCVLVVFLPLLDSGERKTSVVAFRVRWMAPSVEDDSPAPFLGGTMIEYALLWIGSLLSSAFLLNEALIADKMVHFNRISMLKSSAELLCQFLEAAFHPW